MIIKYTLKTIKIPLKNPFVTALRRVENIEAIQLEIFSSTHSGIGEAPATKAITGETLETIMITLQTVLLPVLLNKKFTSLKDMLDLLHGAISKNSSAKACLEIALYNLFAAQNNQTLLEFLGAKKKRNKNRYHYLFRDY